MNRSVSRLATLSVALFVAQACVSDLGSLSKGLSTATDINEEGVAVGTAADGSLQYAVIFESGNATKLALFPDCQAPQPWVNPYVSTALAIASDGVILGSCRTANYDRALLWDTSGKVRDFTADLDSNYPQARPTAMNDAHMVVGYSVGFERGIGWLYEADTETFTKLPSDPLQPSFNALPNGLNERGDVVGNLGPVPVLWTAGTHALVKLRVPAGAVRVEARDINDAGTIVGTINDRPVYWANAFALPTYLSTRSEYSLGQVKAINADGTMVGFVQRDCGPFGECSMPATLAAAWAPNGVRTEYDGSTPKPGEPDSPYARATAINDAGIIVGERRVDGILKATRFN